MLTRTLFVLLAACLLVGAPYARADGLLYKLPADGTWALYALKVTQGERVQEGTLKMAIVGSEKVGEELCRWIEVVITIKTDSGARIVVSKVLIPEKHLKKGAKPIANRVRGWLRLGAETKVLMDDSLGPLPAFLSDPLRDAADLKPVAVQSKLGELECAGVTGHTKFLERGRNAKATLTNRLHDKAPFGVVTSTISIDVEMEQGTRTVVLGLTLSDFGADAKSELPDNK